MRAFNLIFTAIFLGVIVDATSIVSWVRKKKKNKSNSEMITLPEYHPETTSLNSPRAATPLARFTSLASSNSQSSTNEFMSKNKEKATKESITASVVPPIIAEQIFNIPKTHESLGELAVREAIIPYVKNKKFDFFYDLDDVIWKCQPDQFNTATKIFERHCFLHPSKEYELSRSQLSSVVNWIFAAFHYQSPSNWYWNGNPFWVKHATHGLIRLNLQVVDLKLVKKYNGKRSLFMFVVELAFSKQDMILRLMVPIEQTAWSYY